MIKKIGLILSVLLNSAFSASWENKVITSLNLSQNSNHNWTAGGEDALIWQASLNASSEAAFSLFNWKNQIELIYGRTKIDEQNSRKHLDKIFLESLANYNLSKTIKPYISGRVESQFTKSYDYSDSTKAVAISNVWDPGYLTESIGLSFIPNTTIQTRLGFAFKQTFSETYGWADDKNTNHKETFRNEPGFESISELDLKWNEILSYKSRISFFANFKGYNEIDARWENALHAQVAKYMTFSAGLEMLYDKDLSHDSQLRQNLLVGFTFQLL